MGDTKISWTMGDDGVLGKTWNPTRGCSRVSPGCNHCYAETFAARFAGPGKPYEGLVTLKRREVKTGATLTARPDGTIEQKSTFKTVAEAHWTGVVRFMPAQLAEPLRWRKPRRVFVNSMSDLFHDTLTNEQIAAVFGVMAAAPRHTFQILTKRPARMRAWFQWIASREPTVPALSLAWAHAVDVLKDHMGTPHSRTLETLLREMQLEERLRPALYRWPLSNVWLGTSVENQAAADERIEDLLATPAAIHFLSCEPLLGPLNIEQGLRRMLRTTDGRLLRNDHRDAFMTGGVWRRPLDWIIAGCESGRRARPCDPAWLRSLRDQCAAAAEPPAFFLKQAVDVRTVNDRGASIGPITSGSGTEAKGRAGRATVLERPYLDGVQHLNFPTTVAP